MGKLGGCLEHPFKFCNSVEGAMITKILSLLVNNSTCLYVLEAELADPPVVVNFSALTEPGSSLRCYHWSLFRRHDASQSVGFPMDKRSACRRDLYLTIVTAHKHPCHRRDWNPQFQQASGRRPMPYRPRSHWNGCRLL